jgi:phosphate transport system protein
MYMTTRLLFHEELTEIDETIVRMGNFARANVRLAVDAYNEGSVVTADRVLDADDKIDDLEVEIESNCLRLLALQQPMARDLRRISSAIKVSYELERVGDHAVQIAKNTRKLVQQCFCTRPLVDIGVMAVTAARMLDDSLTAFLNGDIELVNRVCENDDLVDDEYKLLRDEVLMAAGEDRLLIAGASYTLLIITSLERIADHATNIAERVAFLETGELRRIAREHRLSLTHYN